MQNVQPVDLLDLGAAMHQARASLASNSASRRASLSFFESFARIGRFVENHRGGDHRAAQRTATDLVDARDQILHQIEIQTQLHQRRSTSCRTASAACAEGILAQGPMDGIEEFHLLRAVVQQRREVAASACGVAASWISSGTNRRPANRFGRECTGFSPGA